MQLFDRTLGQWLERWAEETPDKEYIVYSDRNLRFTWSQLNRRVDDMAKGLIAIGVERGTHVGIWAANVPDWLTLLYACAKIGAVYVTVNTNYKQSELEYLCQNSDMHTLCIVNGEKDSDFVQMTYTMLPELKTCERGHLKSERFPYMRNVVYVGQEKHRGMYNTAEILLLGDNVEDDCLNELKSKVDCPLFTKNVVRLFMVCRLCLSPSCIIRCSISLICLVFVQVLWQVLYVLLN